MRTPLTGGVSGGHVVTSANSCARNSKRLHISVIFLEFRTVILEYKEGINVGPSWRTVLLECFARIKHLRILRGLINLQK